MVNADNLCTCKIHVVTVLPYSVVGETSAMMMLHAVQISTTEELEGLKKFKVERKRRDKRFIQHDIERLKVVLISEESHSWTRQQSVTVLNITVTTTDTNHPSHPGEARNGLSQFVAWDI